MTTTDILDIVIPYTKKQQNCHAEHIKWLATRDRLKKYIEDGKPITKELPTPVDMNLLHRLMQPV